MDANTLLKAAIGDGTDKLSPRDCWLSLAYLYSGGNSAEIQLANAIKDGLDKLAQEDVLKCLAEVLNPSTNPPLVAPLISSHEIVDADFEVDWVWSDNNPAYWQLQNSSDQTTWSDFGGQLDGTQRSLAPVDRNLYYRISGFDSDGNAVTLYSNVTYAG